MTDQTAQEPTMEEILASIRRIISEDDAPAETAPVDAAPAPAPEPAPAPVPEPVVAYAPVEEAPALEEAHAPEEDVLELTEAYEAPAAESIGDLDISTAEPFPEETVFAEAPAPEPEYAPTPAPAYESLVGDSAAASAASAFAGFASTIRKPDPIETMGGSGPTVDELARSLLRPMLKEWLDANLPAIVEAQVRKEVERIARNAG
jgi:cell pole-organizing protein PopZ